VDIWNTTADNTIFFRLPTPMTGSTVQNPDPPGFVIRLSPGDIAGLAAGSHPYTLVVTTSYGTETFNGTMTTTRPEAWLPPLPPSLTASSM
jgi:hypothetical protein